MPLIDGWIRHQQQATGVSLALMQDNAPAHAAKATIEDLRDREVNVIPWPAYSPDLNPIETVWSKLKDDIVRRCRQETTLTSDRLRTIVYEAYEAVEDTWLQGLIAGMPGRCEAVIQANGMHIPC